MNKLLAQVILGAAIVALIAFFGYKYSENKHKADIENYKTAISALESEVENQKLIAETNEELAIIAEETLAEIEKQREEYIAKLKAVQENDYAEIGNISGSVGDAIRLLQQYEVCNPDQIGFTTDSQVVD